MKQVIQNYKSGELKLAEVPVPLCKDKGVLVSNRNSLISAGTEKLMINLAKKSLLGKARERPDKVKKVIKKIKTDGIVEAYRQSMARLEKPQPLGYSCAGVVKEVGEKVSEFSEGDRVACRGVEHASHAEMVYVPENLCVKIPRGVSFKDASFVTLGAIALHAVRISEAEIGENMAVIGLGLLGQMTVQLLKASGCEVIGCDLDEEKNNLAGKMGAKITITPDKLEEEAEEISQGKGIDKVIIFASTSSNQPIRQAAEITRDKAKVVVPGMVNLNIPREKFYKKELELIVSRSSGPGIYDEEYEEKGKDYPISYIRWTSERNMKAFLELVEQEKVNLEPLITHEYEIEDALEAYDLILDDKEDHIGVVLNYSSDNEAKKKITFDKRDESVEGKVNVGVIGAGLFAKGTMLPILSKIKDVNLRTIASAEGHQAKDVGENYDFSKATTDYEEILQNDNIDAVIIAAPHNLHAKLITEALQAGKDVFSEKPLCIEEEELKQIIEAYQSAEGRLMVGFNRRFSPHAGFLKNKLAQNAPFSINCRVNTGHIEKESWVHDPEVGGGNIIGEVCHFVDLIQYLTDSLPVKVQAMKISSNNQKLTLEDNMVINLKTDNGSVASITYTALGDKSASRERIEIFGNQEVGVIDDFKNARVYDKETGTKKNRGWSVDRGHKDEYQTFIGCLKEGKTTPADFKEYVVTTLTTFRIKKSLEQGGTQKINLKEWL